MLMIKDMKPSEVIRLALAECNSEYEMVDAIIEAASKNGLTKIVKAMTPLFMSVKDKAYNSESNQNR